MDPRRGPGGTKLLLTGQDLDQERRKREKYLLLQTELNFRQIRGPHLFIRVGAALLVVL